MPQAGAQQHPLQAKLPRVQSMLALQQQVSRGMWAERHLKALSEDEDNLRQLAGVLECTRETQRFLQRQPKKQQSAQTKCAPYITYSRFFSQPLTNTHLSSAIIFQEHCVRLCGRLPFRDVRVARVLQRRRQEAAAGRERRRAQRVRRPEAAARDLHAARELKAAARGGHAVRSQ